MLFEPIHTFESPTENVQAPSDPYTVRAFAHPSAGQPSPPSVPDVRQGPALCNAITDKKLGMEPKRLSGPWKEQERPSGAVLPHTPPFDVGPGRPHVLGAMGASKGTFRRVSLRTRLLILAALSTAAVVGSTTYL